MSSLAWTLIAGAGILLIAVGLRWFFIRQRQQDWMERPIASRD